MSKRKKSPCAKSGKSADTAAFVRICHWIIINSGDAYYARAKQGRPKKGDAK